MKKGQAGRGLTVDDPAKSGRDLFPPDRPFCLTSVRGGLKNSERRLVEDSAICSIVSVATTYLGGGEKKIDSTRRQQIDVGLLTAAKNRLGCK